MDQQTLRRRNRRALALLGVIVVGVFGVPRLTAIGDPPTVERPTADVVALVGNRGAPGTPSWTPWPQALHDSMHSGASTGEGPTTGHVRWLRDLGANITPGPVVAADGTVYAATSAGVLFALDPADGRIRWRLDERQPYGSDLSTSPAVLPDRRILWPGPGSELLLVTPRGRVSWRLQLSGLVMSPAVRADGQVAVATSTGRVLSIDCSGRIPQVDWSAELGTGTYGSPALSADGLTVFQTVDSGVVAMRLGVVVWRSTAPADVVEVSPAVTTEGTVVVGSNDGFEYGLDQVDGHTRWRYHLGTGTYSSPIAPADGLAYFGDDVAAITGVDASTGRPVYRFQGARERLAPRGLGFWTAPVVDSEHRLYGGTRQGVIYGAGPDGTQLFAIHTGQTIASYPALTGDGALIIGDTSGVLRAIADE